MRISSGFLAAIALFAQQPAGTLDFEVVSVKQMDPTLSQGGVAHTVRSLKSRYEARNLPLRDLILTAYRLRPYQLVGGPKWLTTAGWDVDAKYPAGASGSDLPRMRQGNAGESLPTGGALRDQNGAAIQPGGGEKRASAA